MHIRWDIRWLVYAAAALVILGPFVLGLPRAYVELTRAAPATRAVMVLPAARPATVSLPLRRPEP